MTRKELGALILILTTWRVQCVSINGHPEKDLHSARNGKMVEPGFTSGSHLIEVLAWAVEIEETGADVPPGMKAEAIATDCQLLNDGALESVKNWFLLSHDLHKDMLDYIGQAVRALPDLDDIAKQKHSLPRVMSFTHSNLSAASDPLGILQHELHKAFTTTSELDSLQRQVVQCLSTHKFVRSYLQEAARWRQKRQIQFPDPKFGQQWHLVNHQNQEFDINVTGVWQHDITGSGVTVAVVDDGIEWRNPDLVDNYNAKGSWDLNDKDSDPSPHGEKLKNHHGTRCAGEIAAASNSFCGVGVAYRAGVSGLRVLDGPMTDSLELMAFTKNMDVNDIYSCSWGPDDDGLTVDGPHYLAKLGLRRGINYGRNGYGAVYVVASGNGGQFGDNCNYDGYANSVYTLTIGAVDEVGAMPYYAEECASMLAVTFSSGNTAVRRSIVTTDWTQGQGHSGGCTNSHTGTSAAAPLAAGMVALMLEVRPCLTWRDVQYIIAVTAVKVDRERGHYSRNGAGLSHSHKHGFGLLNAWRLVNTAQVWPLIPFQTSFVSEDLLEKVPIPGQQQPLKVVYKATAQMLQAFSVHTLEYVQVTITLSHARRGDLEIRLRCPSNTESIIGAPRKKDKSKDGFKGWTFSTVRCWGESPLGNWTLLIKDKSNGPDSRGQLAKWQLKLFGSAMTASDVQHRIELVQKANRGQFLSQNVSLPCDQAPFLDGYVEPIPQKWLQVIVLVGAFCIFMVLYETFEYAFCYDKEKKEFREQLRQAHRAARRSEQASSPEVAPEQQHLLQAEEFVLNDLGSATSSQDVNGASHFHEVPEAAPSTLDSDGNSEPSLQLPYVPNGNCVAQEDTKEMSFFLLPSEDCGNSVTYSSRDQGHQFEAENRENLVFCELNDMDPLLPR